MFSTHPLYVVQKQAISILLWLMSCNGQKTKKMHGLKSVADSVLLLNFLLLLWSMLVTNSDNGRDNSVMAVAY
ncbi:hypothetical protein D3C76_1527460 [compost metagenome]